MADRRGDVMRRMAMMIGLRPEKVAEYKALHTEVWPGVLARISAANIRNYTIFLREPENILFGKWEYHGQNYAADMAAIAADPVTQSWWKLTDPCQIPLESRAAGDWWAMMEEVFHHY
ncbi:MAG: L-rhamnose mutarotase [Phaeovulum sp.]|uniref:L-rhamnose mutarotase n=1 Tax=Phaeovulum sp. TaxID=2934796 RepID=UPI002730F97D|nr:L-rhamnose mutarotase [Phaeovulum sp.]MDP2063435.1 L-rhamnose mutarotase [Phaeovulum sp.]MDP3861779.1 L-rhamnose mutarotase [Phaeovulum sp.]